MTPDAEVFTAVGIPWDSHWDVVVLDPVGNVVATASAARRADVEQVGRTLLRGRLPRGRRPIRLRVECAAGDCRATERDATRRPGRRPSTSR